MRHRGTGGDTERPEKLTERLLLERLRLDQELERHRRLMAVMFVDIAGSTRFYEQRGDVAGLIMVQRMESLLLPLIEQHGGVLVKTIGDAVMCRFDAAEPAVRCAIQVQRELARQNSRLPQADQCRMRAAINYGFGFLRGNDIFGDFVNVASRIEGKAEPGEIVISPSVYEQIQAVDDLPVRPKATGVELKGISAPLDLYEVLWREDAPRPPHPSAPSTDQLRMATGLIRIAKPATSFVLVRLFTDGSMAERYPLDRPVMIAGQGDAEGIAAAAGDFEPPASDGRSPGEAAARRASARQPAGAVSLIPLPQAAGLGPHHARFLLHDGLWVEELDPERAVFVRLHKTWPLRDRDEVVAGNRRFRFELRGSPASAADAASRAPAPGAQSVPAAFLVLVDNAGREVGRYPLAGESIFGRTRGNYTFLDDFMSGKHFRIQAAGSGFVLEDLGSTNGTFVRIRGRTALSDGDVVRLGSCLLKVLTK